VRRNEDNTSLPRKPSYSSLQYSTIDHSKTIRARNKNQNQTSSLGPKITSPKPSLSLEKILGKRSSPIMRTGSNSIPDKVDGDGKENLEEEYEIPQTEHCLLLTEEANNKVGGGGEISDDNEYEPIQSPDTWQLSDSDKGENNSYKTGEKNSIVTTPVISSLSSKFSDRSLPSPPTVAESVSTPWSEVDRQPWYQDTDRNTAHLLLNQMNSDGGFLVRSSKHGGPQSPFTLSVYNQGRVFNINIRIRPDGLLALGKEKADENTYSSIGEMIENHRTEALKLTSASPGLWSESNTTLNCWPIKR